MRQRFLLVAFALAFAGCSSHLGALPNPSTVDPAVFQKKLVWNWAEMPTEPIQGVTANPGPITMDSNHKIWVAVSTAGGKNALDRIAMDTKVTASFPISIQPSALAVGPDQNFWVTTKDGSGKVARITPNGIESDYVVAPNSFSYKIVTGSDGALWFPECNYNYGAGGVGRIDTSGNLTFYSLGCVIGLTSGPDGNIWYGKTANVNVMTTKGVQVASYATPLDDGIIDMTSGSDGAVYVSGGEYTPFYLPSMVRVTTAGVVTDEGGIGNGPNYLVNGPENKLWMVLPSFGNKSWLASFDLTTQHYDPLIRAPGKTTFFLTVGPDGNIWTGGVNSKYFPAFVAAYVLQVMKLSPLTLAVHVGKMANISVSEKNYSGQWTAVSKKPSIASVTPNSQNGTFVVTGVAPGTTFVTVYDTMYNSADVKVVVQ